MAAKAYITPSGCDPFGRFIRWWRWYGLRGSLPHCTISDRHVARYMYTRMMAEVDFGAEHRAEVIALYRKGERRGLVVDHVVPLSAGGLHVRWNMQLLTRLQNGAKGGSLPDDVTRQLSCVGSAVQPYQGRLL